MFIQAFGLKFIRLQEEDIELVRYWRNSEKIRPYMNYKGHITREMQNKWFENINNISNYYFIIQFKKSKIGLVKLNDVNYDIRNAETGIFIWNEKHIGSGIPVISMFMILDFAFYFLRLQKVYGPVLKNNTRAINYYLKIGGFVTDEKCDELIMIECTRRSYESKSPELKKTLLKSFNEDKTINMVIEKQDFNNNLARHLQKTYDNLPIQLKKRLHLR